MVAGEAHCHAFLGDHSFLTLIRLIPRTSERKAVKGERRKGKEKERKTVAKGERINENISCNNEINGQAEYGSG